MGPGAAHTVKSEISLCSATSAPIESGQATSTAKVWKFSLVERFPQTYTGRYPRVFVTAEMATRM